jgi:YggT family protein
MYELLNFIGELVWIYSWIVILSVILSWLVAFNVVNTGNRIVSVAGEFLFRVTEPLLRPIRRVVPNIGGIDISPVILLLILWFVLQVAIPNLQKHLA